LVNRSIPDLKSVMPRVGHVLLVDDYSA